jgi:hypothetical protein
MKALAAMISREIFVDSPNVKFSDIIKLDEAKRLLSEAVMLPLRFPFIFTGLLRYTSPACLPCSVLPCPALPRIPCVVLSCLAWPCLSFWLDECDLMMMTKCASSLSPISLSSVCRYLSAAVCLSVCLSICLSVCLCLPLIYIHAPL